MAGIAALRLARLAHSTVKIRIFAKLKHQTTYLESFAQGLRAHGHDATVEGHSGYQPCDLAVFWGHRFESIIEGQRSRNLDYLVMECGFLGDRLEHIGLGFNGLNGNATFYPVDDDSRGREFHDLIKPWQDDGDYYLICGQVMGDASLAGVDYVPWVQSLPRCVDGVPVLFRPHPKGAHHMVTAHPYTSASLADDLAGARAVWTWNSNSGLDALLAGVPVVAFDRGAMYWHEAAHTIGETVKPDRVAMVNRIAWCQWTWDEIERGIAWDHLKQRYE